MGLPKQTHTIGDHGYEVEKFGARKGLAVMARIVNLIGPAIRSLASTGNNAAAMGTLLQTLSPLEVLSLAEEFASHTQLIRQLQTQAGPKPYPAAMKDEFDEHFVDRYDELIEYLVFAVLYNFGKSLLRGKALGGRLETMLAPYLSPTASAMNGSSSASSAEAGTT